MNKEYYYMKSFLINIHRHHIINTLKRKIHQKTKKINFMESKNDNLLNIIHFNDVYDIEPENNKGGVARFFTALQKYSTKNPLILFSGDVFSPSHRKYLLNQVFSNLS